MAQHNGTNGIKFTMGTSLVIGQPTDTRELLVLLLCMNCGIFHTFYVLIAIRRYQRHCAFVLSVCPSVHVSVASNISRMH